MNCKYCGKEIVVDEVTKVGVCSGCGRKYAISVVVRAKVCKACNADLVNKGAYWECPNCGKKYAFSKKKTATSENKTDSDNTENLNNQIERKENDLSANNDFSDIDIDVGGNEEENINNFADTNLYSTNKTDDLQEVNSYSGSENGLYNNQTSLENNNFDSSTEKDIITPSEADYIIPSASDTVNEEDFIIPQIEGEDIVDDEIIDDLSESSGEDFQPTDETDELVEDDLILDSISNNDEKANSVVPNLYDDNGEVFNKTENKISVGSISSMQGSTKEKNESAHKSRSGNVLRKILAVVFGLLTVLAGIACYVFSHFDLVVKIANLSIKSINSIYHYVATWAFLAFFSFSVQFATIKKIGYKRIGMVICIFSPLILILAMAFKTALVQAKIYTYVVYAGYAVLLLGSFLTMVLSAKNDQSKEATAMGVVLFVFSLVSLLLVAVQMIPLKTLHMEFLKDYIRYFYDIEKVLLGFANISTCVLIGKK